MKINLIGMILNNCGRKCFAWLRDASEEQAPKVRAMMLAALDVLRRGIE